MLEPPKQEHIHRRSASVDSWRHREVSHSPAVPSQRTNDDDGGMWGSDAPSLAVLTGHKDNNKARHVETCSSRKHSVASASSEALNTTRQPPSHPFLPSQLNPTLLTTTKGESSHNSHPTNSLSSSRNRMDTKATTTTTAAQQLRSHSAPTATGRQYPLNHPYALHDGVFHRSPTFRRNNNRGGAAPRDTKRHLPTDTRPASSAVAPSALASKQWDVSAVDTAASNDGGLTTRSASILTAHNHSIHNGDWHEAGGAKTAATSSRSTSSLRMPDDINIVHETNAAESTSQQPSPHSMGSVVSRKPPLSPLPQGAVITGTPTTDATEHAADATGAPTFVVERTVFEAANNIYDDEAMRAANNNNIYSDEAKEAANDNNIYNNEAKEAVPDTHIYQDEAMRAAPTAHHRRSDSGRRQQHQQTQRVVALLPSAVAHVMSIRGRREGLATARSTASRRSSSSDAQQQHQELHLQGPLNLKRYPSIREEEHLSLPAGSRDATSVPTVAVEAQQMLLSPTDIVVSPLSDDEGAVGRRTAGLRQQRDGIETITSVAVGKRGIVQPHQPQHDHPHYTRTTYQQLGLPPRRGPQPMPFKEEMPQPLKDDLVNNRLTKYDGDGYANSGEGSATPQVTPAASITSQACQADSTHRWKSRQRMAFLANEAELFANAHITGAADARGNKSNEEGTPTTATPRKTIDTVAAKGGERSSRHWWQRLAQSAMRKLGVTPRVAIEPTQMDLGSGTSPIPSPSLDMTAGLPNEPKRLHPSPHRTSAVAFQRLRSRSGQQQEEDRNDVNDRTSITTTTVRPRRSNSSTALASTNSSLAALGMGRVVPGAVVDPSLGFVVEQFVTSSSSASPSPSHSASPATTTTTPATVYSTRSVEGSPASAVKRREASLSVHTNSDDGLQGDGTNALTSVSSSYSSSRRNQRSASLSPSPSSAESASLLMPSETMFVGRQQNEEEEYDEYIDVADEHHHVYDMPVKGRGGVTANATMGAARFRRPSTNVVFRREKDLYASGAARALPPSHDDHHGPHAPIPGEDIMAVWDKTVTSVEEVVIDAPSDDDDGSLASRPRRMVISPTPPPQSSWYYNNGYAYPTVDIRNNTRQFTMDVSGPRHDGDAFKLAWGRHGLSMDPHTHAGTTSSNGFEIDNDSNSGGTSLAATNYSLTQRSPYCRTIALPNQRLEPMMQHNYRSVSAASSTLRSTSNSNGTASYTALNVTKSYTTNSPFRYAIPNKYMDKASYKVTAEASKRLERAEKARLKQAAKDAKEEERLLKAEAKMMVKAAKEARKRNVI